MDTELLLKSLSAEEIAKRNGLAARKPYVAEKLARISEIEERGDISPIIRLEKSYLCNFQCTHCSAEYYMDRHLEKVKKVVDDRPKMSMDDVRALSKEADELGLARFVITGGEPLVMRDFDEVVAAIDPDKHYIISDTNGWFLDDKKAQHLKSIGVEKVQLSLDSYIEADHDKFRNKPGSYKRVMRAIDASLDAGLNLLVSTVLVNGRAGTKEFEELCRFCTERDVGLYISYAKPTGSCTDHPEFVITKEDADIVRQMEKTYKIFTHMTPSYGSFKGCITTKGIITVTNTMEVTPCPYIDMSIGNLRQTGLKEVLARGMRNPWMGPYRPDCIIGEDPKFISLHTKRTAGATLLPIPWGEGFSDDNTLHDESADPIYDGLFDQTGRANPVGLSSPVNIKSRNYFSFTKHEIDLDAVYQRVVDNIPGDYPTLEQFKSEYLDVIATIKNDPALRGMLNGVHMPIMLPQMEVGDEGEVMEELFVGYVAQAFAQTYPTYSFKNHVKSSLKGKFKALSGSRHQTLLDRMTFGHVVGVYAPALREYSVHAAAERMKAFPEHVLLAGPIDTAAAFVSNPALLQNPDAYPPVVWMPGLSGKVGEGYHFEAYGYDLTFNRRMHFDKCAETSTCGLVVLAP